MTEPADRYDPSALRHFASAVLRHAGLTPGMAEEVADGLVLADLYGHNTHGLALLADYAEELAAGEMANDGAPAVLVDQTAAVTWDAGRLPGLWVVRRAIDEAERRASALGLAAVAIRRSHHIGCLASFLEAPARRGTLVLVFSSDPSDAHVAPFGGLQPVMTPNPVAAGIPNTPDPVLIDISTSITTAGRCGKARRDGRRLPGPWVMAADGAITDDPAVLGAGGSILPLGGLDHGHKGFGLSLLVEALTQGLSGYGRADEPTGWGAAVLVLALRPAGFAGQEAFLRQFGHLAALCHGAGARRAGAPVRLPGEAALARRNVAEADGLDLAAPILSDLRALADRTGIPLPRPRDRIASPFDPTTGDSHP